MPSADGVRYAARDGGPKFQTAQALVVYRRPIRFAGSSWPILDITSDPAHIQMIARSLQLEPGTG